MADPNNNFDIVFGNDDSDGEFEGFEDRDLVELVAGQFPSFDADQFDNDREFPSDLRLNWSRECSEPLVPPFTANFGLQVQIDENADPIDYFSKFMNDADFDQIALETNRYYQQIRATRGYKPYARMNSWYDTVGGEIKQFLGMTILMGLVDKPLLSAYWSTDSLDSTPYFSECMPRDRFMNLLSFLHLVNNETAPHRDDDDFDPLYKVRPIYDVLSSRFRSTYYTEEHIVIDEGMVPWRGRLRFRQYIPNKPDKFGMKLYVLSESSSGYVSDFDVYTGADFDPDPAAEVGENLLGHSYQVVMGLLRRGNLLNKGYTLYLDNYYSSPILFDRLSAEDTPAVGTVRLHRKEMPAALKQKLTKGDVVFRQRQNLLALKWTDKRDVSLLSTKHTASMVITNKLDANGQPVVKPACVLDYNSHMGGVDQFDQLSKYYTFTRKTVKWWLKLFFHMFNMAVTNSYILYMKNCDAVNKYSHYKFRKELARFLISSHRPLKRPRGRPSDRRDHELRLTERHFPDVIPAKDGAKVRNPTRACVVCNKNSGKRYTPGQSRKRTETRYWCNDCKKPLCIVPCFRRYHTLLHYKPGDSQSDSDSDSE